MNKMTDDQNISIDTTITDTPLTHTAPAVVKKPVTKNASARVKHSLPQISQKIKALETKSIQNVIEIGKLLHEASEQCERGEYMAWLKTEFGWSHGTALNYRNVYDLTQNRKNYDFAKLDISISALYVIARIMNNGAPADTIAVGEAVIKAAQSGRVSFQAAQVIIKDAYSKSIDDKDRTGAAAAAAAATADKLSKMMADRGGSSPDDEAKQVRHATEERERDRSVKGKSVKLVGILKTLDLTEENDPAWLEVELDLRRRVGQMLTVIYDKRTESKMKSDVAAKADRAQRKGVTR